MEALVKAINLHKIYQAGEIAVRALNGVSFEIHSGQFVSFTGPSGSGKTTLLNLVGSLDIQSEGELIVLG